MEMVKEEEKEYEEKGRKHTLHQRCMMGGKEVGNSKRQWLARDFMLHTYREEGLQ